MSGNIIKDYLGIELTAELPFITLSTDSSSPSIKVTNCADPKEQQLLFQNIIIKLREPIPIEAGGDPLMQQAQAIFLIALGAMQASNNEPKKLRECRAALASALESHKSNHLYRSHFIKPERKETKPETPQLDLHVQALQQDLEIKLAISPRKKTHHHRQSAASISREDIDPRLKLIQELEERSHGRVHIKSDSVTGSPSDLNSLFSPQEKAEIPAPVAQQVETVLPKKIKITEVGKRQMNLSLQEHEYNFIIKELDTEILDTYLIYWREGGTTHPTPFSEPRLQHVLGLLDTLSGEDLPLTPTAKLETCKHLLKNLPPEKQLKPPLTNLEEVTLLLLLTALPVEKQLNTPLKRLACQEQITRLLAILPQAEGKAAQDIVRTLSNITITNEEKSSYNLSTQESNSDAVNFALITGRFREIVHGMLEKVSDDESRRPILDKWDECVEEIAKLTCDEDSPTKCCEAFFRYLLAEASSDPVSKQLCHLLRASIQDSYVIPGQELSHIFGDEYRVSSKAIPPTITYTFGAKGSVQVITRATVEFRDKKNSLLFSIIIKNSLSTTLRELPHWNSDIVLEVAPGHSKDHFLKHSVIFPLIDGGFFATRTIQADPNK